MFKFLIILNINPLGYFRGGGGGVYEYGRNLFGYKNSELSWVQTFWIRLFNI